MALNMKVSMHKAAKKGVAKETTEGASPYSEHLKGKAATAMLSSEKKVAGEEWKGAPAESVAVTKPIAIPPDKLYLVAIEGGTTVNLGNYESARIGVTLQVPCIKEDLETAYEWATSWVSDKISKAVAEAKGE